MATLDDKLLGEKLHYYCSSSEDEGDDEREPVTKDPTPKFVTDEEADSLAGRGAGGVYRDGGHNTGPKGVIEDWRRFKQLEKENRDEQDKEKLALAKKLALTARTDKEDQEAKAKEEKIDAELEELLDDDFLQEFIEKRMQQLVTANSSSKKFGRVFSLADGGEFLSCVDEEDKAVLVVMLLYESAVAGCGTAANCLNTLAKERPETKFAKIKASAAGLSKHFKGSGVPALLIYKGGELMTNFIRFTDSLGEDFYASDLENYLIEHGVLRDKEEMPAVIKNGIKTTVNDDDSDSD